MKTITRGFIVPALIIVVALLIAGGGAYVLTQKKAESPKNTETATLPEATSTIHTSDVSIANTVWKTYTNSQHGWTVQYPPNVQVALVGDGNSHLLSEPLSAAVDWYASTCVIFTDPRDSWSVRIASDSSFSAVPCGPTGMGASVTRTMDTVTVDGSQITAIGFASSDTSGDASNFGFNLSYGKGVSVGYEITGDREQYQQNLDVVHAILKTLRPIKNFVPVSPPPNGRG